MYAPPPPPQSKADTAPADVDANAPTSVLGLVPHQLRGFLTLFRTLPITGVASEAVLGAYETEEFAMLLRACNETGYLEALTCLDRLYDEGDLALESVDWEEM